MAIAEELQLKGLQRGPIATDNVTNSPEKFFIILMKLEMFMKLWKRNKVTDYTETSQDTSIVEGEVVYDTKAVFTNQGLSLIWPPIVTLVEVEILLFFQLIEC